MINDYYEYQIAEHFISAIINGDCSGLDDCEETLLNTFLKYLPVTGTWDVTDDSNFVYCDITGMYSLCYTMKLHFHNTNLAGVKHEQE